MVVVLCFAKLNEFVGIFLVQSVLFVDQICIVPICRSSIHKKYINNNI